MAKKESYRNARKEKYTPVANSLLNDKEATLQAKGLLSIFLSNSEDWEIHMAEIISRSKNGRDAHYKIVNELIELGYFARIQVAGRFRNRFEEMIYVFSDIKQDVEDELENIKKWAEENEKDLIIEYKIKKEKRFKIDSPAPFPDFQETENKYSENKDNNNTKRNKTNFNNKDIDNIDDDKQTSPSGESSALHNDESINLLISNLRAATKDELSGKSFKTVVRKVIDKYNQGKIGEGKFRDYLVTSLANKIEELEVRRAKDKARGELKVSKQERFQQRMQRLAALPVSETVPFYNWLE